MVTPKDDLLPEGLADRLPGEAEQATRIMRSVLDHMDTHGFDRVRPPLVEFETSMTQRMAGSAADGQRRMFRFVDPASLRNLALRSDMTVQVGRIAATSMASAPRPLRLCYAGEVVTIVADQLDPARQRLQMGAELIGSDNVEAATEMVVLAIESLEAAGASGISVDFTLPDLVDILAGANQFAAEDIGANPSLSLNPENIGVVRRALDTKDAGGLKQAGGEAYLPLLYAAGDFDKAIARLSSIASTTSATSNASAASATSNASRNNALAARIDGLKAIAARAASKARITLDPTERHGFEYQSWFGFTIYARGVRGALGRGGTYNISGSDEAATGFSLYIDGLIDGLSGDRIGGLARKTLFLPLDHDRAAADRLRAEGWRTIAAVTAQDDGTALGCSHRLDDGDVVAL